MWDKISRNKRIFTFTRGKKIKQMKQKKYIGDKMVFKSTSKKIENLQKRKNKHRGENPRKVDKIQRKIGKLRKKEKKERESFEF